MTARNPHYFRRKQNAVQPNSNRDLRLLSLLFFSITRNILKRSDKFGPVPGLHYLYKRIGPMRSDFTGGSAQPIFDHLQNDDYEPNQHSLRNRIPDRSGRHGVVQRLAAGLGRKQRRRTGPAGSRLHASRNTAGTYPQMPAGDRQTVRASTYR